MAKIIYDLSFKLRTLSPLHLGSGDFAPRSNVKGKDGTNDQPDVALIVRDHANKSYLPSTSLKGMLRQVAEDIYGKDWAETYFGTAKNDGSGSPGKVTVFGAKNESLGACKDAPYFNEKDEGIFIHARTTIDKITGTAEEHKLYFQEMLAPNAIFDLRILIKDEEKQAEITYKNLTELLGYLTLPEGVPLGKGMADGFGRVCLDLKYKRLIKTINVTGEDKNCNLSTPVTKNDCFKLQLFCEDIFLVVNSSFIKKNDTGAQISAQRMNDLPLFLGTSLSGALKSRAEWLVELQHGTKDDIKVLFGDKDNRGKLAINSIIVTEATPVDITSVKIDRFTGGGINGALFKTDAFYNVKIECSFIKIENELLKELFKDIKNNGLMLGAGNTKGFGWFEVK